MCVLPPRGPGVSYVIIYHFFSDFRDGGFPNIPIVKNIFGHGYAAVVFFFQLSGYVNCLVNESRGAAYSAPSFRSTVQRVLSLSRVARVACDAFCAHALPRRLSCPVTPPRRDSVAMRADRHARPSYDARRHHDPSARSFMSPSLPRVQSSSRFTGHHRAPCLRLRRSSLQPPPPARADAVRSSCARVCARARRHNSLPRAGRGGLRVLVSRFSFLVSGTVRSSGRSASRGSRRFTSSRSRRSRRCWSRRGTRSTCCRSASDMCWLYMPVQ